MWWLLLLLLFNKYKYKENSTWFEAIRVYKSLSQKLCHKAYTARVSQLVRNSHYSLAYTFKYMCTLTACLANENNTQTPSTTPTHTHRTRSNTAVARRTIQRVAFAQAKSTCYNNVYRVFSLVKLEWSGGEARAKRNRERDSTQPSGINQLSIEIRGVKIVSCRYCVWNPLLCACRESNTQKQNNIQTHLSLLVFTICNIVYVARIGTIS